MSGLKTYWNKLIGVPGETGIANIEISSNNYLYVTGWTTSNQEKKIAQYRDAFISKYDLNGTKIWTQLVDFTSDSGEDIAFDRYGNVYIIGLTSGNFNDTVYEDYDLFISKFNSNGNNVWNRLTGIALQSNVYDASNVGHTVHWVKRRDSISHKSFEIDNLGNYYIGGLINGSSAFISKLDSSCNILWTKIINENLPQYSSEATYGNKIAIDNIDNSVYIAGTIEDMNDYRDRVNGEWNGFFNKYDSNGNKLWTKRLSSSRFDEVHDIEIDKNGYIYLTGVTYGNLHNQTNNGGDEYTYTWDYEKLSDAFVSKYDSNGNRLWTKLFGTDNADSGESISVSDSGEIYITGTTSGNLHGHINSFEGDLTDTFISKLDNNGNRLWTKLINESGNTHADSNSYLNMISLNDSIYLTGFNSNNIISFFENYVLTIEGTLLNDSLQGTADNENISGLIGDDIIDGGAGSDTAIYSGKYSNYSFTRNTSSIDIADQRTGTNDGTDTLSNIEYIQFSDQTVEESKVDIVKTYIGNFSDYKFYNKSNGVYQIKTDSVYDDITGYPLLTFTGEAATSSFRDISAIVDIKGTFDQVTGLNTDDAKMFRLYNAAFARFPDTDGLNYWISKYSSGENDSRAVASSFLVSAEFKERYGENVDDSTYVNTLYKNVLGRDADTGGLNYWLGQLNSGAETRYEVLLGFAESAENKALFTEMTGFG
tara:strand:- start:1906 stop:4029 length:2124 start_codon:yes stop_codon:yes gene_type:complete